jgi:hypothetical protein
MTKDQFIQKGKDLKKFCDEERAKNENNDCVLDGCKYEKFCNWYGFGFEELSEYEIKLIADTFYDEIKSNVSKDES